MDYRWEDFKSDSEQAEQEWKELENEMLRENEESEEEEVLPVESQKQPAKENTASGVHEPIQSWQNDKSTKSKEQSTRQNEKKGLRQSMFSWTKQKSKSVEFKEQSGKQKKSKSEKIPVIEIDEDEWVGEMEEPKVKLHYELTIQGIKVEMPVKPYSCQEDVIKSIISGCKTQQNCLLESPTGSGKTLALLCGSLAWQSDFQSKLDETNRLQRNLHKTGTSKSSETGKASCGQSTSNCCEVNELDLSVFDAGDWADDELTGYNSRSDSKIPKIYYGSRTHRQISQVVKELKKTVYRNKRMTVLSSREISCIQETNKNKTELCAELLDPAKKMGCPYYNENNKLTLGSYIGLAQNEVESPWDIEDLVSVGREKGLCPYFAARSLMQDAEIIFCPYNYLIDPAIRETLQLDVHGHIIILDEAHNIEDFCREAGSVSLTDSLLETIVNDCKNVLDMAAGTKKIHEAAYASMIQSYCERLRKFIESTTLKEMKGGYDAASSDHWTGTELITVFDVNRISRTTTDNFIRSAREAICVFNIAKEDTRQRKITNLPTLSTDTVRKLEMIVMALNMITSPKHAVDYRAVIKQVALGFKKEKSLEFMCMNPGVVFGPLCDMARSIILASGTLAPTSSFAGELGVKFPFTIQANHVTPQEQICIQCVAKGSKGKSLKATYQNVNTWDFQDEVGTILHDVCEAVPHGILMFFSSYTVMNSLINRWESNNTLNKVSENKEIFQETRGSGELTSMMSNFREVIKNTSNGPVGKINGAVLFAVFRGKVAEGIDFSDNEARAVLTVGIPFSVRNDPAVDMKYRYNDANKSKGLLSGYDWYTVQAFRALNQALGRAIRHQNDWGAIILIDERFLDVRYMNLLPAWVRSMWIRQTGPQPELIKLLKDFVAKQKKREQEKNLC